MSSGRQTYQPLSDAIQPYSTQPLLHPLTDSTDIIEQDNENNEEDGHDQEQEEHSEGPSSSGSQEILQSSLDPAVAGPSRTSLSATSAVKRKPGRPKGSKTKKRKLDATTPSSPSVQMSSPSARKFTTTTSVPPTVSHHMTPADRQFYDFQWRVLTLCREFYEAAGELVQGTPEEVISKCYGLGNQDPTGRNVDPLSILNDAKKACDYLLSNPSALLMALPTTPSSVSVPMYHHPSLTPATSMNIATNTSPNVNFPSPASSSPFDAFRPPSSVLPPAATLNRPFHVSVSDMPHFSLPTTTVNAMAVQSPTLPQLHINQQQGAWTDEESERLRTLAEENRTSTGEVDWDKAVSLFGVGRSRHQILIKATSMGLKPSSTRASRQRQRDAHGSSSVTGGAETNVSPALSTSSPSVPIPASVTTQMPPPQHASHGPQPPPLAPQPQAPSQLPNTLPNVVWPAPHHSPYYRVASSPQTPQQHQAPVLDAQDANPNPFLWTSQLAQQRHPSETDLNGRSHPHSGRYDYR